jgi:alanyl aminopeptidase
MSARAIVVWLCLAFAGMAQTREQWRLPARVRPIRIQAELTIDPAQPAFTGHVSIDAVVKERASEIRLNALGLTVSKATISAQDVTWSLAPAEQSVLRPKAPIEPGKVRIDIDHTGALSDTLNVGPYRRKNGEDWYVFTTFTPIEGRRAFACFDEPGIKSVWALTLRVPKALFAASNTPVTSETRVGENWQRVRFAQTPALPAEVIAFAVGPFDVVQGTPAGSEHVPVRVPAPRGKGALAGAAAKAAAEIVARLEAYAGIPYPWEKLDHVALLEGAYGAVENPGMITYRQQILLAPEGRSDTAARRASMTGTMAHELAHQYFGKRVTQADWNDVWLSEGFATWLGGKIADADRDAAQRGLGLTEARDRMLTLDAGLEMRPVR